jgi:two-component system LytT family response regulator
MSARESISVVVVEDEHLARARAVKLVREQRDLVIVAEAGTGPAAVEVIEEHRPDLALIDIALPELNAFEVLGAVNGTLPLVVFMTAFDQFAVKAFEIHAVDYLLKPLERERFTSAIERVRKRLATQEQEGSADVLRRLAPSGLLQNQRLLVRSGERIIVVAPREIDWIVAVGNYVKIHRGGESLLVRHTLATLEERLRSDGFVRIQRSIVVNARKIVELVRESRDSYAVVMSNGTKLRLGERYRENLKSVFGEL